MLKPTKRNSFALILLACALFALSGFGRGELPREETNVSEVDVVAEETNADGSFEESFRSLEAEGARHSVQRSAYDDPRWPTTNLQLLAIPEEDRYYNAWNHVWTNCTVAGPVVNVFQAKDSAGAPIFISIGANYPSRDCVTLVVWADAYYDFAEMINAVDDGDAWLSVTGYLSEYNGGLQFDISDGYVEYTWWG